MVTGLPNSTQPSVAAFIHAPELCPAAAKSDPRVRPHCKLLALPQEVLWIICRFLNPPALQNVAHLNRAMCVYVGAQLKDDWRLSTEQFIQRLIKKMGEEYPGHREKFEKILQMTSFNKVDRHEMKARLTLLKREFIAVISDMDAEAQSLIIKEEPPHFLQDIVQLGVIERRINQGQFVAIMEHAIETRTVEQVIATAKLRDDHELQEWRLQEITRELINNSTPYGITLARQIVAELPNGDQNDRLREGVAEALMRFGDRVSLSQGNGVIGNLSDSRKVEANLYQLAQAFLRAGDESGINNAISLARNPEDLSPELSKALAQDIVKVLRKLGEVARAADLAEELLGAQDSDL